ncbi:acetolactate synthase I/II/III large subunit [Spiroplasma chinense]|uniref:Acetolactate synthase I/II/III large subunit n=1 Tax=Spiroplasma chinense TaxID=216932 RepID=A0A5B9Y3Z2_9MOLU|nr:acetolactate synthase AlsS [Spiroplasma chinense]QEH61483.1 acetolactate synthase I/II/III large subunit [Spiroplasma chinense]
MKKNTGASLVADTLINHGVEYVFTVPGAKIDKVIDELDNRKDKIKMIVCRHEQNAALIAQGIGRISGKPGVVLVTSGPGVSNLATGLVTATSESDPVLAIGGNVKRRDANKRRHQAMANVAAMAPLTKFAEEVEAADSMAEVLSNAYRSANSGRKGAAFVSIPMDVSTDETEFEPMSPSIVTKMGHANIELMEKLIEDIKNAKLPVLLLGMRSSDDPTVAAIRELLSVVKLPVVETFQGAGIIPRHLEDTFFGRVGLFKNQPGDLLLDKSDLVIAVGYDPIEYDPEVWNKDVNKKIYHIDSVLSEVDNFYKPHVELIGSIKRTIKKMACMLKEEKYELSDENNKFLEQLKGKFENITKLFKYRDNITHPLQLMWRLRQLIDDESFTSIDNNTLITTDVGSIYIWMARNFKSYEPRKLLFSNGMQTLGVALPWAIAGSLLNPGKKVISMSGDGGFLFSGQELETAVREKLNITHIIWNDNSYNMVDFQQVAKYGKSAAVELGPVDFAKYAEAFGAKGFDVKSPDELESVLREALSYEGVAIVNVPIDYTDNGILGNMLLEGVD